MRVFFGFFYELPTISPHSCSVHFLTPRPIMVDCWSAVRDGASSHLASDQDIFRFPGIPNPGECDENRVNFFQMDEFFQIFLYLQKLIVLLFLNFIQIGTLVTEI